MRPNPALKGIKIGTFFLRKAFVFHQTKDLFSGTVVYTVALSGHAFWTTPASLVACLCAVLVLPTHVSYVNRSLTFRLTFALKLIREEALLNPCLGLSPCSMQQSLLPKSRTKGKVCAFTVLELCDVSAHLQLRSISRKVTSMTFSRSYRQRLYRAIAVIICLTPYPTAVLSHA